MHDSVHSYTPLEQPKLRRYSIFFINIIIIKKLEYFFQFHFTSKQFRRRSFFTAPINFQCEMANSRTDWINSSGRINSRLNFHEKNVIFLLPQTTTRTAGTWMVDLQFISIISSTYPTKFLLYTCESTNQTNQVNIE